MRLAGLASEPAALPAGAAARDVAIGRAPGEAHPADAEGEHPGRPDLTVVSAGFVTIGRIAKAALTGRVKHKLVEQPE